MTITTMPRNVPNRNFIPDHFLEKRQSRTAYRLELPLLQYDFVKKALHFLKIATPEPVRQPPKRETKPTKRRVEHPPLEKKTQQQQQQQKISLSQLIMIRELAKTQENTKLMREIDRQLVAYAQEIEKRLGHPQPTKERIKETLQLLYMTERQKAGSVKINIPTEIAQLAPSKRTLSQQPQKINYRAIAADLNRDRAGR